MSKELTPLEAFDKIIYDYGYDKNVEIVSKALQENIVLNLANIELEHHLKLAEKELKENEPKLQALEIIKEFWGNSILSDIAMGCPYTKLPSKEKIELLKEVLL